jgi:hypothetical protein
MLSVPPKPAAFTPRNKPMSGVVALKLLLYRNSTLSNVPCVSPVNEKFPLVDTRIPVTAYGTVIVEKPDPSGSGRFHVDIGVFRVLPA